MVGLPLPNAVKLQGNFIELLGIPYNNYHVQII